MKQILLFSFAAFLSIFSAEAQTEKAWTPVEGSKITASKNVSRLSFPTEFKLFHLDIQTVKQALGQASDRFSKNAKSAVVSFPNAEGNLERFEVFEASNFDAELQAQFPEIRSYAGTGIDDKYASIRLSISPEGIQTMVFRTGKRNEFMEPYSADGSVYAVYNSSRNKGSLPFTCSTEDKKIASELADRTGAAQKSNTGELLNFRLAMSCNGEYTTYFGGTVAGALAAINASINRVNGVFEKDFAIHMTIIASTTSVIYTNAGSDPYTTMGNWNGQLQGALTANIGEANYDVGHMFGASGGGGNAGCIGCVCVNGQKGSGITSPADGIPMGDNFDIDYVAHELGHQFGGNHTFSNSVEGSGVNVEPGSGSTIMGYAGITAQDIQAHSDDYFVYATIKQVQDNMAGKTCPTKTTLSNGAPVTNAGIDYTIPKSTPFILTGSAVDPNGNPLTYCWEQNDTATTQTGAASAASATKTGGPNWRSYDPVASPSRYCPPLARVLANQTTTAGTEITVEALSSVARTLTFVLTARDNVAAGPQTGSDTMVVTVNGTAGPFAVTAPNTAVSWQVGTNQAVTWNVAGTTANGVNAAYVDILLSTDGGNTYPIVLASKVPNDGTETITVPNNVGANNRLMVKGYNHIFYDLSNTNFTIAAPASTFSAAFTGVAGEQNKVACQGTNVSYNITYQNLGGFSGTTTFTAAGNPPGSTVTFAPASTNANGTVVMTVSNTNGSTAGFYNITATATSGATVKTVPFYLELFNSAFSAMTLSTPADLAVGQGTSVNLTWAANSNATSYDVQVATDSGFTNIISSGNTAATSYTVSGLAQATAYFWRVLPKNVSCSGTFSTAYKFTTGVVSCGGSASTNVPLTIATTANVTINSTLNIPSGGLIDDVNITMNVTHTWINDLTATLISPSGTQVQLYAQPCTSDDIQNITATFDDAGSNVICGTNPGITGTVKPTQSLSAFNGQSSTGVWTLRILDGFNQDGGSLNSWSLNICTVQTAGVDEAKMKDFVIYPNPNNGSFNVQLESNSGQDIKINVHDISGRVIFEKSYQNSGVFNQNLQLTNAQAGVYLVTVEDGGNKTTKRIIVK